MHFAITLIAVSVVTVLCRHQYHPLLKSDIDRDYEYTQYNLELVEPSKNVRRSVRKIRGPNAAITHRKIEIIVTEATKTLTTSEDRKLRYNEKVYLPVHQKNNSTSQIHQKTLMSNLSAQLMLPTRAYSKQEWDKICYPLTGSAHPDGPLDYFDAIQAMRPPYFFPSSDEGPAFVKFFDETRFHVHDHSKLKKAMTKFLKCLLSVISHVPEDVKRKKMTKMFFSSMIGWLKDSLLVELYVLSDRPDKAIIEMEDIVQALLYMRNRHFNPAVAKEALKTYEFVSLGSDDGSSGEQQRSFQFTTAIMITTGVSFLFLLVILGACVAAALGSPAMRQLNQLPDDFLPLDYRPSQLMDRSGRSESLTLAGAPRVALPAGYDQQVRKLSVLPDSSLASKVRRMSEEADREQLSPLLGSERTSTAKDGSTSKASSAPRR